MSSESPKKSNRITVDRPPTSDSRQIRRFVVDDAVRICSQTIFTPGFALLVPAATALYTNRACLSWDPALWLSTRSWTGSLDVKKLVHESKALRLALWYAGTVVAASLYSQLSYAYDQRVRPFSRPDPLHWDEQIIVITGGAHGIGSCIAMKAAARGAKVIILDVTEPSDQLQVRRVLSYTCDVSDRNAVNKAAQKIIQEVGFPTILVNNAGVMSGKLILDLQENEILRTFGVNVMAHFWTLQAFLPGMIAAGRGHILNVASLLGITGNAQLTDYCASKAAVITLHDSLTYELHNQYRSPEIRTTLVIPSHIRTHLFSEIQFPSWGGLFPFIAPSLEADDVAEAIIDKLDKRENGTLRLPLYSHLGRLMGLAAEIIPGWARDFARWGAQSDSAMRRYRAERG